MKGKRLEEWTIDDFLKLHKIAKYHPERKLKKWTGIKKASKEFEVTEPTIWKALKIHPTPPSPKAKLVMPRVAEDFYKTEGWEKIKGHKFEGEIENTLTQIWNAGLRVDPYTWSPEIIENLRKQTFSFKDKEIINPIWIGITNDIAPEHATQLRRAIQTMRPELKDELLDELKDVPKRPHGARLSWYLEDNEITTLIKAIDDLEVLTFTLIGLSCGARPISLAGHYPDKNLMFTTDKIDRKRHSIRRYESKKRVWVYPKFDDWILDSIEKYIQVKKISYGSRFFSKDQNWFSDRIREAGLRGQIKKFEPKGAGAYVLRHTFATQAAEHDVSLEVVMLMGGWTEPSTLQLYYMAIKESKIEREILGLHKEKALDFKTWFYQFKEPFETQFNDIIEKPKVEEKPKVKAKVEEKPKKVRVINWEAIEAQVKAEKGVPHLREWWKKALALHKQGVPFSEIKRRLAKK